MVSSMAALCVVIPLIPCRAVSRAAILALPWMAVLRIEGDGREYWIGWEGAIVSHLLLQGILSVLILLGARLDLL